MATRLRVRRRLRMTARRMRSIAFTRASVYESEIAYETCQNGARPKKRKSKKKSLSQE